MEKYYTPEIEEFHVGFECEVFVCAVTGWRSISLRPDGRHLDMIVTELKSNQVRVKYLDKEDIESLGWILDKVHENENQELFHRDNIVLYYRYDSKELGIFTADPSKSDYFSKYNIDPCKINTLVIKNKSELKKLMKQLNIMK